MNRMPIFELHNGDCLEVMKDISSNSIDLIICDLPYGCLAKGAKGCLEFTSKVYVTQTWDVKIDLDAFWIQVKRISKTKITPVLMFCSMRFYGDLFTSNPSWFQYGIVWKKNKATNFMDANIKPINNFELIAVFGKQRPYFERKEGPCMRTVLEFDTPNNNRTHPTEKPVDLYKFLIERYCPAGGTVLDPTFGSCNSGRAAESLGRSYIGIEKDEGFFKKAAESLGCL